MYKLRVLIADDQYHARAVTAQHLQASGGKIFRPLISEAETAEMAVSACKASLDEGTPFDLVILDIHFHQEEAGSTIQGKDGHWAASKIRELLPDAQIIIVSAYPTVGNLRLASSNKAVTRFFQRKSFRRAELFRAAVWSCLWALHKKHSLLEEDLAMFTRSPLMLQYLRGLDQVQPEAGVIIYGETGTGKELSARRLNANAKFELGQEERPFVALNCAALSENLIESELFGHIRGAFTGANSDKEGYLSRANGGDLFLDELQSASIHFQKVLMRALQERTYSPVGSTRTEKFNIRVISALNMNLSQVRAKGQLMPDFVARLREDMLEIPALRQRPDDFELLIEIAKQRALKEYGISDREFSEAALEFLMGLEWKENVRGFMGVCMAALSKAKLPVISAEDLKAMPTVQDILSSEASDGPQTGENTPKMDFIDKFAAELLEQGFPLTEAIEALKSSYLENLFLSNSAESLSSLAQKSGIPKSTIRRRLDEFKREK